MQLRDLVLGATPLAADRTTPGIITPKGVLTRADVRNEVDLLAASARVIAPPGGRIAILADNRPEVVALLLAIPAAGRIAVPLNTRLTSSELLHQLDHAGVVALVGTGAELERAQPAIAAAATLETTVGIDAGVGDISLSTLTAAPASGEPHPSTDDDPAWIIYTSGTTGQPKGVILTARSLGAAVGTTAASRPLAPDDTYLYPFPLYHVSAYNVLHGLARQRPVVLPRQFDVDEIADLSAAHRVTAVSLAPTMLRMVLDHPAATDGRLATWRTVAYGAAPMPPALLAEAAEVLGVEFAQGYGMTELSGNAVFLPPEAHRAGLAGEERLLRAAGWPADGVELRVIDTAGEVVPAGEPGEITIRARQVCAGYWDDPEATARTIRGGWLHTGDLGTIDDDGLLTVVDRLKDIIVTGGENVASREVEEVLEPHAAVARVAVVGLPDERWGEAVTAAIVLRPGTDADPDDVVAELTGLAAAHLAGFKVPKRIELVRELPVNAGGKVMKVELRRRLLLPPG